MRPDLAKCTTESPRAGGSYERRAFRYRGRVRIEDPDSDYLNEAGGFKSNSRYRLVNHKNFTDRLGALRGNIRVNVGRPWDDVYSEFSRLLDRRSLSGHHIWTHLEQMVQTNCHIGRDGKVYARSRYGSSPYEPHDHYVHPETGLLCEGRGWSSRYRKPKVRLADVKIPIPGNPGWNYQSMDGLWFGVLKVTEEIQRPFVIRGSLHKIYTETIEVETRRYSANKKEIAYIRGELKKLPLVVG